MTRWKHFPLGLRTLKTGIAVTLAVLLVFVADCFLSARVLRRGGDIDLLSLCRLASALRTA